MTSLKKNLIRELDHSMPAAKHAGLGSLLEELIVAHNASASVIKVSLGAPIAVAAGNLVSAATSTELPNNATITYTGLTDNASPLDGAIAAPQSLLMSDGAMHLVYTLDVARNLTCAGSHGSAFVAMTVTVVGFDINKNRLIEKLTLAAGGTTQTAAGLKAFKYVESFALTSAGNATTNTLSVGIGDVLGLPVYIAEKSDIMQTWFNQVVEATAPTVVVGDLTAVSDTTGDIRGTVDLNSASNGSAVRLWLAAGSTNQVTPLSER